MQIVHVIHICYADFKYYKYYSNIMYKRKKKNEMHPSVTITDRKLLKFINKDVMYAIEMC